MKKLDITVERLYPSSQDDLFVVNNDLYRYMNDVFAQYYPGFTEWYKNKIVPGFRDGTRVIIVARIKKKDICGVSILRKLRNTEKKSNKICSFYVSQEGRGNGIGHLLMINSLREFEGYDLPIVITVPEERLRETVGDNTFSKFLKHYGFELVAEIDGKYRQNKKEMVFLKKL